MNEFGELPKKLQTNNVNKILIDIEKNKREVEDKKILENIDKIEKFINWRNEQESLTPRKCLIRIEYNYVSVFTNDIEVLRKLSLIFSENWDQLQITQIVSTSEKNVKTFSREPKHKFRVYLRDMVLRDNLETFYNIKQVIKTNKKTLFPSIGLDKWLNPKKPKHVYQSWQYNYVYSMYFIDYDDENMLSYLHLMLDKVLGKSYKLEKRET